MPKRGEPAMLMTPSKAEPAKKQPLAKRAETEQLWKLAVLIGFQQESASTLESKMHHDEIFLYLSMRFAIKLVVPPNLVVCKAKDLLPSAEECVVLLRDYTVPSIVSVAKQSKQ